MTYIFMASRLAIDCDIFKSNIEMLLSEQEHSPQHPIIKKLGKMHEQAQELLQEN